jgi:hypothetical protein
MVSVVLVVWRTILAHELEGVDEADIVDLTRERLSGCVVE